MVVQTLVKGHLQNGDIYLFPLQPNFDIHRIRADVNLARYHNLHPMGPGGRFRGGRGAVRMAVRFARVESNQYTI